MNYSSFGKRLHRLTIFIASANMGGLHASRSIINRKQAARSPFRYKLQTLMASPTIRRALISVSDKLGVVDFARGLVDAGVEIYSTGGTRKHLEVAGVPVIDVSSYTGFPEMMDGRLKTLHPRIFGGILCRHDRPDDIEGIAEEGIVPFELVVVNLYPFEATISRDDTTVEQAVEKIDIGGPSLVRAAAKNFKFVTIATSPAQYASILEAVTTDGGTTPELRSELMAAAFEHTANYDRVIADYFAGLQQEKTFPQTRTISLTKKTDLRYGENPHQQAAVYSDGSSGPNLLSAKQLNGKELSYNNLLDLDAALAIVRAFDQPAASVMKHNNPCGAAVADTLVEAARKGMAGDPVSAFGSVLGFNRTVDEATAELLAEPGLFVEAIVAPDFSAAALGVLTSKPKWKNNVRLMRVGDLNEPPARFHFRHIEGGMLAQEADRAQSSSADWKVVTNAELSPEQMDELAFAWEIVRFVKSNAIVLCREQSLVGAGAGQMSRVDSVDIAISKAGDRVAGSVLASDAFFPFPDSIEKAAAAGIKAVVQPGGSKRDDEVIAACNELGVAMVFTGRRHFRH